jgi:glycosyltransferase involved in cell wall biosynthesis
MSRIAIVSRNILAEDAIGNDVQQMAALLRCHGHEVELFRARRSLPQPRDARDRPVYAFLAGHPSPVVLYHHSTDWDDGIEVLRRAPGRRIVRYHNVTPEHFFHGLSTSCAEHCRRGREQLLAVAAAGCDLYLADSPYNRDELLQLGVPAERCRVVPPFHKLDHLLALTPDASTLEECRDGHVNLLFVGRCAPNKGHRHLINAFAVYRRHYNPRSRLLLVGKEDERLTVYRESLRWQLRRLDLAGHVSFIDGATDAELRAYYEAADVFVLASEHEGFCVPVVEAMALGVPLVAYGTTATPDTVGAAGLVWDEPDPFLLAESIHRVVEDDRLRQELRRRGWERYQQHFATERLEAVLLEQLEGVLSPAGQPEQM